MKAIQAISTDKNKKTIEKQLSPIAGNVTQKSVTVNRNRRGSRTTSTVIEYRFFPEKSTQFGVSPEKAMVSEVWL